MTETKLRTTRRLPGSLRTLWWLRTLACVLAATSLVAVQTSTSLAIQQSPIDSAMDQDPLIVFPPVPIKFPANVVPLWIDALRRPDSELKQMAADTIAFAKHRGMDGLDATKADLANVMRQDDLAPTTQQAVAKALIALDAKDVADLLWQRSCVGTIDLARVVEPALARWGFDAARPVWLKRLKTPDEDRARLLLAINALGVVKDKNATDDLSAITTNRDLWPSVRMSAAQALGQIHEDGLVERARQLANLDEKHGVNRVLSVTILRQHRDPETATLLRELAADPQAPVAAQAIKTLAAIDLNLVFQALPDATNHPDVRVRRTGGETLIALGEPESIERLGPMLNDTNPDLRSFVATSLIGQASQTEMQPVVLRVANEILNSDEWRGIEQASIVMATLDQKQSADRLLELLEYRRPEVYATSAWALRKLAVPETLPAMLESAQNQFWIFKNRNAPGTDGPYPAYKVDQLIGKLDAHYPFAVEKVSQLFQAFGQMDYIEANVLMRKYIPKDFTLGDRARVAAIWSLGHLYKENLQADLVKAFVERLKDSGPPIPESPFVRRMCAISLGRMKAESVLPTLRQQFLADGPNSLAGSGCAWAISQITGEPFIKPKPPIHTVRDWFLSPMPEDVELP